MSEERLNSELQALLSGYAAGTLSDEERGRLIAAAMEDQEIFDAMAEDEPLRAALGNAGTRAALLAALGDRDTGMVAMPPPRTSPLLWAAIACLVVAGGGTFALWKKAPVAAPVEVAVNQEADKAEKREPARLIVTPKAKPKAVEAPPMIAKREEPELLREKAPKPAERMANASQPPAALPELIPATPQPSAFSADSSSRFRLSRAASAPAERKQIPRMPAAVSIENEQVVVWPLSGGFVYAFLLDGDLVRPLVASAATALQQGVRRAISVGGHTESAEAWVLIVPVRDAELESALDSIPTAAQLPARPWTKLKLNSPSIR